MTSGFLRWKSHVDKLLRFNHMTMTLGAEPFRVVESGAQVLHQQSRENRHEQRLAQKHASATTTIQYAFDSTSSFPSPFLTDSPRFHSSFEPSLRHLPCILFLHSDDPGGFDVARWMAGGMSRAQQLCNPLMPSRFGTYSVYNVQERSKLHTDISNYDRTAYESNIASVRENEMHVNEWSQPSFTIPTPPFSLLSISRPGYLESSPLYTPTFLAQATAISQLVDNLRAPALHIVAHKTSAPIALEMAGLPEFRKRIRSICLIDPQLVPHTRIQSLSGQLQLLGPEWARTRAAYNALARSANDSYFRHAVSEICGTESLIEIDDDPAMAQLYEGIGVFFTHWNLRKPGMLRDILTLKRLDRSSWNSVTTPILCLTGIPQPFDGTSRASEMEDHMAAEESAQAALGDVRSKLEFARVYGSGKLLFPLGRVSKTCLDFIYKHK